MVHLTGDPSLIFSRKQELSIDAIAEYDKRYKQSRPNLSVNVSLSIIEIKTIICFPIVCREKGMYKNNIEFRNIK